MLYEDRNAEQAAADAVRMACNLGTSYVPPKSGAVKPWVDVTNLLHPGDLGPVGTAPWKRCLHAANHFINDATGLVFPRAGTLAEKLSFIFEMNDDVRCLLSLSLAVHVISSTPVYVQIAVKLPTQFIDHPPDGPRRDLHPMLLAMQNGVADADAPYDATKIAAAARQRRLESASRAPQMQLLLLPPRSADAGTAAGGSAEVAAASPGRASAPQRLANALTSGDAATSPERRAAAPALLTGVNGSPLRFLTAGVSGLAQFIQDAMDAAVSRLAPGIFASRVPATCAPRSLLALEPAAASPSSPHPAPVAVPEPHLFPEPSGLNRAAIARSAESVARLFASVRQLEIPSSLSLGDRFLLWHGALRIDSTTLPPLWLAAFGNPGEVWGASVAIAVDCFFKLLVRTSLQTSAVFLPSRRPNSSPVICGPWSAINCRNPHRAGP